MAQEPKKRGRTSGMSVLLMLLLILVGAAGAVGTLLIVGEGTFFGGSKQGVQAKQRDDEDHTGQVAVPICPRPIEAFVAIETGHLVDAKTKEFAVRWVDQEKAKGNGFITDITAIRGRVLSKDKAPGYAFTESDFAPKGTSAGPGAALEKGTRGVWINVEDASGFETLPRFARFDLVATIKLKSQGASATDPRFSSPDVKESEAEKKAWSASQRHLITNGKIIVPLAPANSNRKDKRVFVQVAADEAEALSNALAQGAELIVYARSSQPGAGVEDLPEPERPAEMDTIEVIQGGKSVTIPVPARSAEPEAAPGTDGTQEPK
ncbi:MAG: hypothetical protein IPJ77_10610 [Planctomycetes bacterium]|nr:hypothetical protein [Planctomycetota bacterium]